MADLVVEQTKVLSGESCWGYTGVRSMTRSVEAAAVADVTRSRMATSVGE